MDATDNLAFSCSCDAVTGSIAQAIGRDGKVEGDHVVCHCSDCQAFARFCHAEESILGKAGGTALYQSRCARLTIASGKDRLACIHLTDKPTLRWYAACCDTPMFNSFANGRIPYVTTLLANCEPAARAKLGEPTGHLFLSDATGAVDDLKPLAMATLIRHFLWRMMKDWISGDRLRNPLFDPQTLAPIAPPRRLTQQERAALDCPALDA